MDPVLLRAATAGDVQLLRRLMEVRTVGQATDAAGDRIILGTTPEGNTALHVASKLGHVAFARQTIRYHGALLLQHNSRGDTPLHCAARAGQGPVVSLFLVSLPETQRTELVEMRNRSGNTALHEAVLHGREAVVETLMEKSPSLASLVNDAGASPLYLAAEKTSVRTVELLLQSSDPVSYAGPNGQNALHAAVLRSHEITVLMIRKNINLLQQADETGSTPLHYAASNGDLNIVALLLKHDPSVANLKDNDGLSALHVAASMGHLDLIKLLIQRNPESIELVDNKGRSLLHVAIEKKRLNVVKYTLRAPELVELINEPDYEGNTPLHSAIINRNWQIVDILLGDRKVQVDVMNAKCLTPLDLAYLNTEAGIALRMYKMMVKLVAAGSRFSPRRLDNVATKLQRNREEDNSRCRTLANNLAIVAVLIATVTFAAAFTLPGGYNGQGMAVLTRRWAFRAFLASDATAMVSAIAAACALIYTGSQDHDVRLHSLGIAMRLMWVALVGMVVAFATGTYVVVESDCAWLGILVCLMACSAPLLVWVTTCWPTFDSIRTMKASRTRVKTRASQVAADVESEDLLVVVERCSPLLGRTPKAVNPLSSTTVKLVTSKVPSTINNFATPASSCDPSPVRNNDS